MVFLFEIKLRKGYWVCFTGIRNWERKVGSWELLLDTILLTKNWHFYKLKSLEATGDGVLT